MLSDQGVLTERGEFAGNGEIALPETVHALIAARLDTLAPERKALLHDASVVGKVFWPGAVASIGGTDAVSVREQLRELLRKELVRPARASSVEGEDEFSFWHALVRDVAYGQIPRAARARKHRAAAEWIEGIAAERVADQAEIVAHHYIEALELARASGADEERRELETSARRFLILAGDRAVHLDVAKAEAHYRKTLELLPKDHLERSQVLVKLAETAWLAGRFSDAERYYEEAIAESREHGDLLGAGAAMAELGAAVRDRGETVRAGALLAEAVDLLEQKPAGRELALAYMHTARDRMLSGRYRECREWAEKTRALAQELGLGEIEARVLQFRGIARFEQGDLDGIDDLRESLRMCLQLGLGYETVTAYGNLSDLVLEVEGPARSRELRRTAIEFGERRGLAFKARWVTAESVWELFDLGEWNELLEVANRLAEWEREHGGTQVEVISAPYRAQVLLLRGMTNAAAAAQADFLPRAREIGDVQVITPALSVSALVQQASGDLPGALSLIEELERATRDRPHYRAHHLPDAVRVCVASGALGLAESLFEGTDIAAERVRRLVLAGRAILAEGRGSPEEAVSLFAEAAMRWTEFSCVVAQAQALLGQGRCLVRMDRRQEAGEPLREARKIFRLLGAAPLVAEAEALLGADAAQVGS
jgi:tetratricopeptide (TPR) repeat protein